MAEMASLLQHIRSLSGLLSAHMATKHERPREAFRQCHMTVCKRQLFAAAVLVDRWRPSGAANKTMGQSSTQTPLMRVSTLAKLTQLMATYNADLIVEHNSHVNVGASLYYY